jgi:hypothetical protein
MHRSRDTNRNENPKPLVGVIYLSINTHLGAGICLHHCIAFGSCGVRTIHIREIYLVYSTVEGVRGRRIGQEVTMNKSQGTTMGAVLLAALLFRAGGPGTPASQNLDKSTGVTHGAEKIVAGDGPWAASCSYWAPARSAQEAVQSEASVTVALAENGHALNGSLTGHSQGASECEETENKKWGFPEIPDLTKGSTPLGLNVVAVIATMADPVHTNLGFQFDRSIDALIEAAGTNGYVSTYYWLPTPWRQAADTREGGDRNSDEPDSSKNHEPGLIIFRHFNREKSLSDPSSVLYIFLVGETPTSGVDGLQIQRAFHYEDELKNVTENSHAFQQPTFARSFRALDAISIIGPTFSGSAFPLRQAIDLELKEHPRIHSVYVTGATGTRYVPQVIGNKDLCPDEQTGHGCHGSYSACQIIRYSSFEMESAFAEYQFADHVSTLGGDASKVVVLVEDGTLFGQVVRSSQPTIIRFPREISLLRNAKTAQDGTGDGKDSNHAPSPYLHLSLKDSNIPDSVPHLSGRITPLSQESELIEIQRTLQRGRASYIIISSTNILDALFLAQFLHRAVPDARLVFEGADLLFEPELNDESYIGSLAITPYPLTGLKSLRFPDSYAEEYYNAASYTFWSRDLESKPQLEGIEDLPQGLAVTDTPPLWLTALGSDGYYPLGILKRAISSGLPGPDLPNGVESTPLAKIQPAITWYFLCLFVTTLCIFHAALMWVADYWSPFTRDLDIKHNDQPYRRSLSIRIGGIMLFCIAVVVAWPLFACGNLAELNFKDKSAAFVTLLAGVSAIVVTVFKTRKYCHTPHKKSNDAWFYNLFNSVATVVLIFVPVVWILLCSTEWLTHVETNANGFFAYRCLNPASGVSPLVPLALLLLCWYVWSYFQTMRLRFSCLNRPRLPNRPISVESQLLYVSDGALAACDKPRSSCLYRNIECLLITREVVRRFLCDCRKPEDEDSSNKEGVASRNTIGKLTIGQKIADIALIVGYLCFFALLAVVLPFVQGVDRVLWKTILHGPTLFEFTIRALFFPLLVIALTGWLRMVFVWGSLKRGLLQRLENMPLRFAFDRIKDTGWVAMFRQSGLREQWRDMARSSESMRQIVNDHALMQRYRKERAQKSDSRQDLTAIHNDLKSDIAGLLKHYAGEQPDPNTPLLQKRELSSIPAEELSSAFINAIEMHYAAFAEELLENVLLPYWTNERKGIVQSRSESPNLCKALLECLEKETEEEETSPCEGDDESSIHTAEEFLAIRYIALIRVVLVNLRYLITFISAVFALGIIAWNSYPFEPRDFINWIFTMLLVILSCGVIWVFAQMHRDPILSRITDKRPNELGLDFYLKIVSFGAVPVLTWLAYTVPAIGGPLFQLLKPGVDVMK